MSRDPREGKGLVMSRLRLLVCLASACILVALGSAAPAHADATCNGTIGTAVVVGDVIVPPGASCQLLGTTVTRNVIVQAQGSQLLTQDANIARNIQAEGATRIRIFNTVVTNIQIQNSTGEIIIASDASCQADPLVLGSIQLEENSAAISICKMSTSRDVQLNNNTGRIFVSENTIGANLQLADNTRPAGTNSSARIRLRYNIVGEDIQVFNNIGGVLMNTNTAGMNIQCQGNVPPPYGFGNTALVKEGQCAGL
jgi:hypothetical protein